MDGQTDAGGGAGDYCVFSREISACQNLMGGGISVKLLSQVTHVPADVFIFDGEGQPRICERRLLVYVTAEVDS